MFSVYTGPDLPGHRTGYDMVVNPTGDGVLMLGGVNSMVFSKEIWQMTCTTTKLEIKCKWAKTPYELPTPRAGHAAFYVPPEKMSCSDPNAVEQN